MNSEDALNKLIDLPRLQIFLNELTTWVVNNVFVLSNLAQLIAIVSISILARFISPGFAGWVMQTGENPAIKWLPVKVASALTPLTFPLITVVMLWLAKVTAVTVEWPFHLITIAVSLLTAWIIIGLTTRLVRDPVWAKFIALTAWSIAALNIVGLLDLTINFLDTMAVTLGSFRVSALTVIKGMLSLAVLIWAASGLSQLLEARIRSSKNLTPSVQVLITKLLKIVLIVTAVVAAVSSVGIDLTAFAVFGGALGVGIGLGLQKAVSNLTSGLMLLMDKSIKPGDVIAVSGTYGWVSSLGARYVSVVTRDGIEHLIPNEELVTQRVENWTHSNSKIRLKTPVGVHYQSDVHKAITLCLQAADETDRVLKHPEPKCLLRGFGDNSVDLELRMWIQDSQNGINNVRSEVLLNIWDKFKEQNIEIPYPQRDLHLKSSDELRVILEDSQKSGESDKTAEI